MFLKNLLEICHRTVSPVPGIWIWLLLDYYLARYYDMKIYSYYSTSNGSRGWQVG